MQKYIITLGILMIWTGIVLGGFREVNFQKNYTDSDDMFAKNIYNAQEWVTHRFQSLSSVQDTTVQSWDSLSWSSASLSEVIKDTITNDNQIYSSSDTMSLDDIITSISTNSLGDSMSSTKELEEQYSNNPNTTLAILLITKLSKEYNYTRAYEIFKKLNSAEIKSIDPHLVLRILLNSELVDQKTQNLNAIENVITELSTDNMLSRKDAKWYQAIIMLLRNDKNGFITNLPQYEENETSVIKPLVNDIRQKIAQSSQWNDIPDYYSDGMIALGMFQYWYPYVAQQLSMKLLLSYPNYILPKQILAYSHMILHEWRQAQSYFLQLIESDAKNISTYQFFTWVCSYRLEQYTDAILYLNQIPQDKIVSDATRYKILSYIAIKDWSNVAKHMKALLWYADITNSDMMLAREQMIFEPYMSDESYKILQQDSTLLNMYLERCNNQRLDTTICNIGQIAKDISLHSTNYSEEYLKTIISKFPRSYMYYILGNYYFTQGDKNNAQKSYISAMSLTNNSTIRKKITDKIKTIL